MSYTDKVDHEKFNCSQEHEFDYVAGLYGDNKQEVKKFLKEKCVSREISNSSHNEVYDLIEKELGLLRNGKS